jgi:hypothetical protein
MSKMNVTRDQTITLDMLTKVGGVIVLRAAIPP